MKILVVHNRYRIRAGEDNVFDQEVELLRSYGHEVKTWSPDNREIKLPGIMAKLKLGLNTIWSQKFYEEMGQLLKKVQPDLVHVHNIIPLLSPAIFYACKSKKIPVIQTIHNYRLGCPTATFFREGQVCELCQEKSLLEGIRYGCYRHSRLQTATVAGMLQVHRWLKTWQNQVDGYIAVSQFLKEKLVEIGIPAQKIFVKPNFISVDLYQPDKLQFGSYYLYVGRLVEEKGIRLLIEGYQLANSSFPLVIIGTGELGDFVRQTASKNPMIRYEGEQPREKVFLWMRNAISLIVPSIWYESFGINIIEAYSQFLPVIGSNIGAISELIKPNKTGLLFTPSTPNNLAKNIKEVESNAQDWIVLKHNLSSQVNPGFSPEFNYQTLIGIYQKIILNSTK